MIPVIAVPMQTDTKKLTVEFDPVWTTLDRSCWLRSLLCLNIISLYMSVGFTVRNIHFEPVFVYYFLFTQNYI